MFIVNIEIILVCIWMDVSLYRCEFEILSDPYITRVNFDIGRVDTAHKGAFTYYVSKIWPFLDALREHWAKLNISAYHSLAMISTGRNPLSLTCAYVIWESTCRNGSSWISSYAIMTLVPSVTIVIIACNEIQLEDWEVKFIYPHGPSRLKHILSLVD